MISLQKNIHNSKSSPTVLYQGLREQPAFHCLLESQRRDTFKAPMGDTRCEMGLDFSCQLFIVHISHFIVQEAIFHQKRKDTYQPSPMMDCSMEMPLQFLPPQCPLAVSGICSHNLQLTSSKELPNGFTHCTESLCDLLC